MKVEAIKKPIFGLDKYVHFVILGLSSLNLIMEIISFGTNDQLNSYLSILLSLIGVSSFILILKGSKLGSVLAFIWAIPQIVIASKFPAYHFDLSQGTLISIFSFEQNGYNVEKHYAINILPIIILSMIVFKLKNGSLNKAFSIYGLNKDNQINFNAKIKQQYSLGENKILLVFDHKEGNFYQVIQIDKKEKSTFPDSSKSYSLISLQKDQISKKTLKVNDFTIVGEAKATLLNT